MTKENILGQFFTKETIVEKLLDVLFEYKPYDKKIKILEPSFGTGNFINVLKRRGFHNIDGCEIDKDLASEPSDFFEYPLDKKYDLIIGNPPFTKYNIDESYYFIGPHLTGALPASAYLPAEQLKKEKEKIENIFILKSLRHLRNSDSSIAFVLPISFFIKKKNSLVKEQLLNIFSTVIIIQNKDIWFDYHIPCCFAIFTNATEYKDKIIIYYENDTAHREIISLGDFYEELIPEVLYNKKYGLTNNHSGVPLKDYLSLEKVVYKKSFADNNVSAKNILGKSTIPSDENVADYKLAIVRVGNASVGKCGLINMKKDTLNDMFYVFDFIEKYNKNKHTKERLCESINSNQQYFRNVTCRVGSKSIKKEDIFNFRVKV
jgi:hypothetical protein